MATKRCKHEWVTHTTDKSDFRCKRCGRYGKERRMWSPKDNDYRYRIVAEMPR